MGGWHADEMVRMRRDCGEAGRQEADSGGASTGEGLVHRHLVTSV